MNNTKNYKIILLILLQVFFFYSLFAQQNDCIKTNEKNWHEELKRMLEHGTSRNQYVNKKIRINFHFLLKSDGTGNFNETNDGLGNAKSGYDVSCDLIERMNNDLSWNRPTLNSPNAIPGLPPVEDRKYSYVLDGVFFHRDDDAFDFGDVSFSQYGEDPTEVLNVFFSKQIAVDKIRGVVYNISHNTALKYTDIANLHTRYEKYVTDNEPYSWFLHAATNTIMHEIGHLTGLLHTVYKDGTSTICASTDPNCDDGISDTPTAYEVFNNSNCGIHPAAGWNNPHDCCSRNLMDYEGGHALTPLQIQVIHTGLEGGMKTYNLCKAVETNTTINALDFPKISYYGKEVDIKSATIGSSVVLGNNQPADIYFSSDVEFFPMEVKGTTNYKNKMEVLHYNTCSF